MSFDGLFQPKLFYDSTICSEVKITYRFQNALVFALLAATTTTVDGW